MTLSSEATKVDVKETEMSEEMVEESIAIAKEGLKRCNSDKVSIFSLKSKTVPLISQKPPLILCQFT